MSLIFTPSHAIEPTATNPSNITHHQLEIHEVSPALPTDALSPDSPCREEDWFESIALESALSGSTGPESPPASCPSDPPLRLRSVESAGLVAVVDEGLPTAAIGNG